MGRLNKKWKIIINIVAVVILLAGVLTSLIHLNSYYRCKEYGF